jgi:hypothetical protein
MLRSIVNVPIGPIWGMNFGWLSGFRTQSGQTKVNDGLTA